MRISITHGRSSHPFFSFSSFHFGSAAILRAQLYPSSPSRPRGVAFYKSEMPKRKRKREDARRRERNESVVVVGLTIGSRARVAHVLLVHVTQVFFFKAFGSFFTPQHSIYKCTNHRRNTRIDRSKARFRYETNDPSCFTDLFQLELFFLLRDGVAAAYGGVRRRNRSLAASSSARRKRRREERAARATRAIDSLCHPADSFPDKFICQWPQPGIGNGETPPSNSVVIIVVCPLQRGRIARRDKFKGERIGWPCVDNLLSTRGEARNRDSARAARDQPLAISILDRAEISPTPPRLAHSSLGPGRFFLDRL